MGSMTIDPVARNKLMFGMAFVAFALLFPMIPSADGQPQWFHAGYSETFNLENQNHNIVMDWLDQWVNTTAVFYINNWNPVLGPQDDKVPPPYWIVLVLMGRQIPNTVTPDRPKGEFEYTALVLRSDNLYLVAFLASRTSDYYAFLGQERDITGSIPLGFDSGYTTLLGKEGWRNLVTVGVGKEAALNAISVLSTYGPQVTPTKLLQRSVAALIFMFCEAYRLHPIREFVSQNWGAAQPVNIPVAKAEWVVHWKDISCGILILLPFIQGFNMLILC